jgi:hypothetical protein
MDEQLYKIRTMEGSLFLCRFQPQLEDTGVLYGRLLLLGDLGRTGERLEIRGMGALPEPGSELTVSDEVIDTFTMNGETFPIYPTETVISVEPLPYPDCLVE